MFFYFIVLVLQKAYPGEPDNDGPSDAELLWRNDSLLSIPPTLGDPDETSLNLENSGDETFIQGSIKTSKHYQFAACQPYSLYICRSLILAAMELIFFTR